MTYYAAGPSSDWRMLALVGNFWSRRWGILGFPGGRSGYPGDGR